MNLKALLSDVKNILILGHHNADPDAVCSMRAFAELYYKLNPDGNTVLACDDVSRLSMKVLDALAPNTIIHENIEEEFDFYVVLDTNSQVQLGDDFSDLLHDKSKVLIIDHHEENPESVKIADHRIIRSDRFSTCEMLVDLFKENDISTSPMVANLLLCGILFDTRRFYYADKDTLSTATLLMESGADYEACLNALIIRQDRSERIARLKAASRSKVHTINEWVIATARIGAFEASACRGLIELGADVAIVGGKPAKNKVRLSARSTREFHQKTEINLGLDIMEPLGELIGGVGGGHANAAGANGTMKRKKALKEAIALIRTLLSNSESPNLEDTGQ